MRAWTLVLASLMAACAGINPFVDENAPTVQPAQPQAHTPKTNPAPTAAQSSDMELRLAKLWARVDDLENQHIRQKERMKLLEKGLMLGIIPEELKGEKSQLKNPRERSQEAEMGDPPASVKAGPAAPSVDVAPNTEKSKDVAEYRRMLQQAQDKFNAASYGQAIVSFNEIGEKFDDSLTEGSHFYWIGLSWFYLKEHQLAELSFRKLIDQFNQNAWVPYSRFYLAKIDLNRGLSGRARDQFKLLIDEYPNQDLGEMARMEIDRMREKL